MDINTCSKKDLRTLIGIGEVLADRIICCREYSSFQSADDLINRVKWMGEARWKQICDRNTSAIMFRPRVAGRADDRSYHQTVTRSGQQYQKATYTKKRRGVLGMTGQEYDELALASTKAGFVGGSLDTSMYWRIYSKRQILALLDRVYPQHKFTMRSSKIEMVVQLEKHYPYHKNKEAQRLAEKYSGESMYKVPPIEGWQF